MADNGALGGNVDTTDNGVTATGTTGETGGGDRG